MQKNEKKTDLLLTLYKSKMSSAMTREQSTIVKMMTMMTTYLLWSNFSPRFRNLEKITKNCFTGKRFIWFNFLADKVVIWFTFYR